MSSKRHPRSPSWKIGPSYLKSLDSTVHLRLEALNAQSIISQHRWEFRHNVRQISILQHSSQMRVIWTLNKSSLKPYLLVPFKKSGTSLRPQPCVGSAAFSHFCGCTCTTIGSHSWSLRFYFTVRFICKPLPSASGLSTSTCHPLW